MPWERTDMSEQRVKFVARAASGKERMATLCQEFGVSRPTGYRWRRRFEQAGSVMAVVERNRRPQHSPAHTEPCKEDRVVALRRGHGWGAKKLEVLLREEGQPLTGITINRSLKGRGFGRKKDSHAPAVHGVGRGRATQAAEGGGISSQGEGSDAVSGESRGAGGVAWGAGRVSADLQRTKASRSVADEETRRTLSREFAELSGQAARVGISVGEQGARAEREGRAVLGRPTMVRV